jgi:hypothetical protein
MSGVAARLTKILLLAGLVLGVTASSGAAGRPTRAPILGLVPHARVLHALERPAAKRAGADDVSLKSNPCTPPACWVMRTNTTYAIYWVPSGQSVAAGYETDIDRYLSDVAAASGSQTNVYSVATQYYDSTGWISYQSTFGGSDVDTDAFPASGCSDGVDSICLSDRQIQSEIAKVIAAKNWPVGPDSLFVLMTPNGVGSCYDGLGQQCSSNYYCAYHSSFSLNGEPVLYANEPYDATIPNCDPGSSPNGNDADATINTISHEQNESITDPWGNAWMDPDGDEIADICAWQFGKPLGGTAGVDQYNQVINGHHYWLQQEYSDDGSVCRQHYVGLPANTVRPVVTGVALGGRSLSVSRGSWTQEPKRYAYQWLRCTAHGTGCRQISGATTATHRLVAADAGHMLEAQVAAKNSRGMKKVSSQHTAVVVGLPAHRKAPTVTGRVEIGRRLAARKGSWSGTPQTYLFQWLRCNAGGTTCVAIGSATQASYRLTKQDAGHRLRVRVTAVNAAGRRSATSGATRRVL